MTRARSDPRESRSVDGVPFQSVADPHGAWTPVAPATSRRYPKSQSFAAYAARSRRLARRALMIRIASASLLLLRVYATISTCPLAHLPSRRNRASADECRRSKAIERVGIQEHRQGLVERDAVFRRVGFGLSRIPLEHLLSIYGIADLMTRTRSDDRLTPPRGEETCSR